MPETVKERSELDPQFTWDLSRLFADDAAWEKTLATLEEKAAADRKSTRLNSSHVVESRMPSSA